ncbi:ABC transporter ATP-binding protein [Rhodococcus sp. KBS0724]|jgi:branched-chain amino acid transport system ATP-binding protein|uniref:ABC transporter ATP-binding protein n=1 Tax=Rhodococcus sp. KBS0724 TaxID=1179674 RepID=UPI00110D5545|nr:ABC transporter ATP-binding protein [Rhodococcus sp. KBS0724]TSD45695.1 ABC transporter ATP-binding protein [Rhodococcus sp. KBS0724]
MLELTGVTVSYGAVAAVDGIDLACAPGEVVALLGANGAGKSSIVKAVNGLVRPIGGSVVWQGRRLESMSPERIARAGIATVPEGREIFGNLTVLENLRLGSHRVGRRRVDRSMLDRVLEYYPVLAARTSQTARTLSGGEQQMLVIGRALMAQPELLLLDEPSLGLAPKIVAAVYGTLREVCRDLDLTVLVVEQDITTVLSIASHAHVMASGRISVSGTADEIRSDESLRAIYLGETA